MSELDDTQKAMLMEFAREQRPASDEVRDAVVRAINTIGRQRADLSAMDALRDTLSKSLKNVEAAAAVAHDPRAGLGVRDIVWPFIEVTPDTAIAPLDRSG